MAVSIADQFELVQAKRFFLAEMMCKQLIFCVKEATRLVVYICTSPISPISPNVILYINFESNLPGFCLIKIGVWWIFKIYRIYRLSINLSS
jgi:hypothetical protein